MNMLPLLLSVVPLVSLTLVPAFVRQYSSLSAELTNRLLLPELGAAIAVKLTLPSAEMK